MRLSKYMRERLDVDPFFCWGRVHPSEYDWRAQYGELAKQVAVSCEPTTQLDVGKVLGLAAYAAELERQLAAVAQEPKAESPGGHCGFWPKSNATNTCKACDLPFDQHASSRNRPSQEPYTVAKISR